ncbi:Arylsulfatase [Pontiella desulfatans]|uniref:Arylsulfatase n=1 Tax=Pontiella desulfatans TaxID=2750659 RepID=A0A6C2U575_PONDE|nr:arylsulfatase [Pontiella desulfatans]SPS73936.1 sulfatase S1_20 [Kiritimatiellales bacterium]VGO14654.1 Arylsulfatase [Pontiella desulfatans]
MKTKLLLLLCAALVGSASAKPNVIYILADDLGMGDLGIYGQEKLKTPNIDRIGTEGMRFTDHYSGNTVCSPSRAVLMTGQHPGHVHCRGNGDENAFALDPGMTTLPRLFKNAGYATGAFGKWGLGHTDLEGNPNPMTHGFDRYSGWKSQMIAHTYYPNFIVRNGKAEPLDGKTFVHDLIMQDAFDFISTNAKAGKPFFAYIPTAVPHAAMHAPPELHEKWRKVYPQFDSKIGKYGAGKDDPCPPVTNPIAGFAAMMENLDNQVGTLLDMLKELGIDNNTIVLFASDNGCHHEGGHNPEFWDSNGPLRGIKRDLYEGGIRTPFLVRWPGTVKAGSTSDHLSAFQDILPTMAELTGQPVPGQADGKSIAPLLQGGKQPEHDHLYFEFIRGKSGPYSARALRQGNWKAVQLSVKNQGKQMLPIELYNLETDLGEENNVAAQHPEIVERMARLMDEAHTPLKPAKSK